MTKTLFSAPVPAASAAPLDVIVAALINIFGWTFAGCEVLPAETFLVRGGRKISVVAGVSRWGAVYVRELTAYQDDAGRWRGSLELGHGDSAEDVEYRLLAR